MNKTRTSLVCLPYLPLGNAHQIGDWLILPMQQYTGAWADDTYKARAEQLLRRFVWPNGTTITEIPIVLSAKDGASGIIPDQAQGRALQLAINFATIDEFLTSTGDRQGRMLTTDNAELQIWPISADGYIAYPTGLMVRTTWGGWNLDDDEDAWRVPSPMELFMPLVKVSFYDRLANAIYETVTLGDSDPSKATERRLAIALVPHLP